MKSSLLVVLFVCILPILSSTRISNELDSDRGRDYIWQFYVQLLTGSVGIVFNTLTLCLILSLDKSKRFTFYTLNVVINVSDTLFSIVRTSFSAAYFHDGHTDQVACQIETVLDIILILISLISVVGMSVVARYDLCHGKKFTEKQMLQFIGGGLVYSLLISFWCVFNPWSGGVELDTSGSFCFIVWSSIIAVPSFAVLIMLLPMSILWYNVYIIYITVKNAQSVLVSHGINEQAKGRYILMVMKLNYFLIAITVAYLPVSTVSLYEWSTNQYYPGIGSAIGGDCCAILYAVVNPSLFFYLNIELRDHFWNTIGVYVEKFLYDIGILQLLFPNYLSTYLKTSKTNKPSKPVIKRRRSLITVPQQPNVLPISNQEQTALTQPQSWWSKYIRISKIYPTILPSTEIENRISESTNSIDYDNVDEWLNDPILKKYFLELGRKEYCIENFLFYDDARAYHKRGLEFIEKMIDYLENSVEEEEEGKVVEFTEGLIVSKSIPEDLISEWKVLESLSVRLYTLYIQSPIAPLEINIPHRLRREISTFLNTSSSSCTSPVLSQQPSFPELLSIIQSNDSIQRIQECVELYINVYNHACEVVYGILETDLFPRFIKSGYYNNGIVDHKAQTRSAH